MLVISASTSAGLSLVAFIEKVTIYGALLSPRIVWSDDDQEFVEYLSLGDTEEAFVEMTESGVVGGLYTAEIADIDSSAEQLQITIIVLDTPSNYAIGTTFSLPGNSQPSVTIALEVNEDRNS